MGSSALPLVAVSGLSDALTQLLDKRRSFAERLPQALALSQWSFDPVSLALVLLAAYFISLVIAYMLLITPGRRSSGLRLLLGSVIFPLLSTLAALNEVEKIISSILEVILREPPLLFLVLLVAWILLSYLFFEFSDFLGEGILRYVVSMAASAYAVAQIGMVLMMGQMLLAGYTALGMTAAVAVIHFLVSMAIVKLSKRARAN